MTGNRIGDAPVLPKLLNQIPVSQNSGSDTKACYLAIAAPGAAGVILARDATPEIG
jgi:hypothetical protein